MKNKILTTLFAFGLSLTLAACGNTTPAEDAEAKVLEDKDSAAWALHGQFLLADGETVNGWNGKDNALYEASKMTAISIKDAKAINAEVGAKLAAKNVKYLYKYEGAIFGKNDAGWTADFLDAEGAMKVANGSYVFKAVKLSFDAEDEVYAEDQWIHDPKTAHSESLDGNMFIPTWTEEADEHGFDWSKNAVVRSGAGKYTVIVAQYKEVSAADVPGYGIAVVKTGEVEGGIDYEVKSDLDYLAYTSWGLVGSMSGWGSEADIALTKNGDVYEVTTALAADVECKIRPESKWENDLGFDKVDTAASTSKIADKGGNIQITAAGTYKFALTLTKTTAKIVVTEVA